MVPKNICTVCAISFIGKTYRKCVPMYQYRNDSINDDVDRSSSSLFQKLAVFSSIAYGYSYMLGWIGATFTVCVLCFSSFLSLFLAYRLCISMFQKLAEFSSIAYGYSYMLGWISVCYFCDLHVSLVYFHYF